MSGAFRDDDSQDYLEGLPEAVLNLLKQKNQQDDSVSLGSQVEDNNSYNEVFLENGDVEDSRTQDLANLDLSIDYSDFKQGVTADSDNPDQSIISIKREAALLEAVIATEHEAAISRLETSLVAIIRQYKMQDEPSNVIAQVEQATQANDYSIDLVGQQPVIEESVIQESVQVVLNSSQPSVHDSDDDLQLVETLRALFQKYLDHLIKDRKYSEDGRDAKGNLNDGARKVECAKFVLNNLNATETSAQDKINNVKNYLSKQQVQKKLIQNCDAGLILLKAISCVLLLPLFILGGYSQIKYGTCNFFKSEGRRTLEKAEDLIMSPRRGFN